MDEKRFKIEDCEPNDSDDPIIIGKEARNIMIDQTTTSQDYLEIQQGSIRLASVRFDLLQVSNITLQLLENPLVQKIIFKENGKTTYCN